MAMLGGSEYTELERNRQWLSCWSKLVARSWVEKDFRRMLLEADASTFRRICFEMGYALPAHADVTVMSPTESEFQYRSGRVGLNDAWMLPHVKVVLVLPPAPPADQQAIAMVDYLQTELDLAFTCPC